MPSQQTHDILQLEDDILLFHKVIQHFESNNNGLIAVNNGLAA